MAVSDLRCALRNFSIGAFRENQFEVSGASRTHHFAALSAEFFSEFGWYRGFFKIRPFWGRIFLFFCENVAPITSFKIYIQIK